MMSGGSYEYLYRREVSELLSTFQIEMLESMAISLTSANAGDTAIATWEVIGKLKLINQAMTDLDIGIDRLRQVWHAMEWWESHDIGEDGFKKALEEYRKARQP